MPGPRHQFVHQGNVPNRVQIVHGIEPGHVHAVAAGIGIAHAMQRLMDVAGEVHQESQFLRFRPRAVGAMLLQVHQVLAHLGDDAIPLRAALGNMGRAFEQSDIDVVPGCRSALAAGNMVGPDRGARHGFGQRIGARGSAICSTRCSKGGVLFQ